MNTNATTFVRYAEPTLRSNVSQAYSQCSPEPSYSYSPEPDYGYGSYYGQPAPMQQQPAPVQAPVAQSSSALKPLLVVAGLAVVGAAAFGGIYLMNSSDSQPQPAPTAATSAAPAQAPTVNLPQIQLAAPAQNGPASVPVIVNNPAPVVRVSGPAVAPRSIAAQSPASAPQQIAAPAQALAPAPAPAPAPDPASAQPNGPGVSIQTPLAGVNVGNQGGVKVNTPGVSVGVPGKDGGDVKVSVGSNTGDDKTATTATDGTTNGNTTANAGEKGGEAQNNDTQDKK
jgi:hypothetical protein